MDLHLGAAVAEAARTLGHGRRHLALVEQPLVELRRRHACDDGALRGDEVAACEADAHGSTMPDEHPVDVLPCLADAAAVADQPHERLGELRAAAARDRHAALLHRDRDHLRHEARRRSVGTEACVEHPRREHAVRSFRRERRLEPVAARLHELARKRSEAATPETPERLRAEGQPRSRPELGAEQAESEVCVRKEPLEDARPLGPELARVALCVAQQEGRLAVGIHRSRGQIGVEVLEPARRKVVAEQRVRGAADPERMPRAEDVVQEPRLCELGRVDRAAEPVVALEHADAPAVPRKQRAAGEGVHAAADDHRVVFSHRP